MKPGDCVIVTYKDMEVMGHVDYIEDDLYYVALTRKVDGLSQMAFPRADVKPCPVYPTNPS